VPQDALLRDANSAYVLVVGEAKVKDPASGQEKTVESAAVRRPVQTDRLIGANWIVTGGLNPGDKIITQGVPKAKENSPVKASPAQAAPADGAPGAAAPAKAGSSAAPAGKQ
jgi:membrane fusion protein (multidrug efflux system)